MLKVYFFRVLISSRCGYVVNASFLVASPNSSFDTPKLQRQIRVFHRGKLRRQSAVVSHSTDDILISMLRNPVENCVPLSRSQPASFEGR